MTFDDIPDGTAVFIGANTFVYAYSHHAQFGAPCRQLLDRIERQQLSGITSAPVLAETAHRLMTLEACASFGWSFSGIAARLKRHPGQVQQLATSAQPVDDIAHSRVQIVPVEVHLVVAARTLSRQTGLLTNDALILSVMQDRGLIHLASHDADFDRVPWLTRYAPV